MSRSSALLTLVTNYPPRHVEMVSTANLIFPSDKSCLVQSPYRPPFTSFPASRPPPSLSSRHPLRSSAARTYSLLPAEERHVNPIFSAGANSITMQANQKSLH